MQVKAQEVFNSEMMSKISHKRIVNQSAVNAKAQRVQAWKEMAIRQFPGMSEQEAFQAQREWDEDHR